MPHTASSPIVDLRDLRLDTAISLVGHDAVAHPAPPTPTPTPTQYLQRLIDGLCDLSLKDPLTGLANRRHFQAVLEREIDRVTRSGEAALLLMLDIDRFKQVNDTYGHDTGDELLRTLARRLRAGVRGDGDIVARFGGDEFVVVAANLADEAQAPAIGRHLREVLTAPVDLADGRRCQVGVSIGWALAPRDGRDAAGLLRQADAAMYASKAGGRAPGAAPA